jgi:biofilm regulator BssS
MSSNDEDRVGVLVGWTTQDMGTRLVLRLQSVTKPPPHTPEDVTASVFLLSKNQAVQLGNNLFQASGETAPARKKSWLDKLLGG